MFTPLDYKWLNTSHSEPISLDILSLKEVLQAYQASYSLQIIGDYGYFELEGGSHEITENVLNMFESVVEGFYDREPYYIWKYKHKLTDENIYDLTYKVVEQYPLANYITLYNLAFLEIIKFIEKYVTQENYR